MVLQSVAARIAPVCEPKLARRHGISLLWIDFFNQIIGAAKGLFDFFRQRKEVGAAKMDRP